MSNRGVEAQLNVDVVKKKNFVWDVQINVTALKNKITKLPNSLPITQGTKRLEEGKDIFAFYLRRWYGVDPTDGAGLYYATPGTALANVRVTPKGDTVTTNPNFAAQGYTGSSIPKFFGSFTNTFSYKNFSLSFLFNYQVGGKFYDGNYAGLMAVTYGRTLHVDNLGAWKKPGDIATVPRLDISQTNTNFNSQSDRWLIDASYLNVRNVTLTYKLPAAAAEKMGLSQARFFVGGENLHIFSKRKGLNPAESFNGTNSAVYTPNRLINMGINVSF
jgi:hypothetical protein